MKDLETDDFVVAKFTEGKFSRNFVGKILGNNDGQLCITFLRESSKVENIFIFPQVPDESVVDLSNS